MAKLTKTNKPNRPQAAPAGGKSGNPTLIVGVVLAVLAALLFWLFLNNMNKTTSIMVAKTDIPAFSNIQPDQVEVRSVPADSVNNTDLTQATYQNYVNQKQPLINRVEILPGQRVPVGALVATRFGSLGAIVKGNEQVVAVSTSVTGAVASLVVPGSVVDVYAPSGDNNQPLVVQAKVLGVGVGSQASSDVRSNNKNGKDSGGSDLVVLLAVKTQDVGKLLAQSQVALSYNPHKSFDDKGNICDVATTCRSSQSASQSPGSTTGSGAQSSALPGQTPQTPGSATGQSTTTTTPGG